MSMPNMPTSGSYLTPAISMCSFKPESEVSLRIKRRVGNFVVDDWQDFLEEIYCFLFSQA